jgi:Putative amidoligase enzyme
MKRCSAPGCYSDAVCCDGRCGQHTLAVKDKRDYSSRRYPRSSVPHLGVEIECFARDSAAHRVLLAQRATPCQDGSLPTYGCEFKVCLPARTAVQRVPLFAAKLASVGAVVNTKCGLHVHLDMRGVSWFRRKLAIDWLRRWQEYWFASMPPSRRDNDYVLPIHEDGNGHYTWAHNTHYETIEVRVHGGTLNPHKIRPWLMLMADLMALIRSDRPLPELPIDGPNEEFLAAVFPTEEGRLYLMRRHANYGVLPRARLATPSGMATDEEEAA